MTESSFRRIEHWLTAHAPRILDESLNPGATEAQLAALEATIGQPLPDDYKALYRWHNGLDEDADNFGSLFYGMSFLPLVEVEANYRQRASETETAPLSTVHPAVQPDNALTPHWLCLAFDGSHTWLRVDLTPTAAGTYGQVIFVDEEAETAFPVAESVAALLAGFADDLEQGRYTLNADALEDGNEYLEPAADIDVVNWFSAARWQNAAQPTNS